MKNRPLPDKLVLCLTNMFELSNNRNYELRSSNLNYVLQIPNINFFKKILIIQLGDIGIDYSKCQR